MKPKISEESDEEEDRNAYGYGGEHPQRKASSYGQPRVEENKQNR